MGGEREGAAGSGRGVRMDSLGEVLAGPRDWPVRCWWQGAVGLGEPLVPEVPREGARGGCALPGVSDRLWRDWVVPSRGGCLGSGAGAGSGVGGSAGVIPPNRGPGQG